jgi:cytochrome P450
MDVQATTAATGADEAAKAQAAKAEADRLIESLQSPDIRENPYPTYAALRDLAPVHLTAGMAYLTRYDDCLAVIRNPALGAQGPAWMDSIRPGWRDHPGLRATHESFVFRDPPDHTRLRRQVSGEFSPSKVKRLRGYIAEVTAQVLDLVADAGADGDVVDLHEILATTLPINVIGKILGVPPADHPMLREPLEGLRLAADGSTRNDLPIIDRAGAALINYFAELAAERRKAPRNDLVSALVAVRDSGSNGTGGNRTGGNRTGGNRGGGNGGGGNGGGGPDEGVLTEDEMLQSLTLIFSAAIESMADLLLNGTAALIAFPAQAAALRADPGLTAGAVEETLRYDAPVQGIGRIPGSDLTIGGVLIPAGTFVLPLLGAGNRDPDRFPDPDTFDLTRTGPAPLSLSGGAHFCLGAALARLEAAVFFPALTSRFPALQLAAPPVRRGFALRGFASFPVTLR